MATKSGWQVAFESDREELFKIEQDGVTYYLIHCILPRVSRFSLRDPLRVKQARQRPALLAAMVYRKLQKLQEEIEVEGQRKGLRRVRPLRPCL